MSSSRPSEPARHNDPSLLAALEEARSLGFLGPGPIDHHLDNAAGFARAVAGPPARALDLGSGGGVPGLILAVDWPDSTWVLLDATHRRCEFLRWAIAELELGERVSVYEARAETAGRDDTLRSSFGLVTARGFGRPAVTAECGGPFLAAGGVLLVSEPPDRARRWDRIDELGLSDGGIVVSSGAHIRRLTQVKPCPERYPRRVGVPAKRPLW